MNLRRAPVATVLLIAILAGCAGSPASQAPSQDPTPAATSAPTTVPTATPIAAATPTVAPTPVVPAIVGDLDQSQERNDLKVTSCLTGMAQTFTSGRTGGLATVSIVPLADYALLGDVVAEIRTLAGGKPSDTVLGSAAVGRTVEGEWAVIAFASPVPVTEGSRYALVLRSAYGIDAGRSADDVYAGGEWQCGEAAGWTSGGGDLAFRTYVVGG